MHFPRVAEAARQVPILAAPAGGPRRHAKTLVAATRMPATLKQLTVAPAAATKQVLHSPRPPVQCPQARKKGCQAQAQPRRISAAEILHHLIVTPRAQKKMFQTSRMLVLRRRRPRRHVVLCLRFNSGSFLYKNTSGQILYEHIQFECCSCLCWIDVFLV